MLYFNKQIKKLIKEYNLYSRANTMLYKDNDVAEMLKCLHNVNRDIFINKMFKIERELIPLITPYHNRMVIVTDKDGKHYHGIIEHLPTREYTNSSTGKKETTDNTISFRKYNDNSEGIALWVNTGNKFTTHLYNAEDIELKNKNTADYELEDLKNECELNTLENQPIE